MLSFLVDPANYAYNPYAVPTFLTTAAMLALGLTVFVRERRSLVSATFLLVVLTVCTWQFAFSWMYCATNERTALWWAKIAYLGVPLIPSAVYHFTVVVLGIRRRFVRVVRLSWILSVFFAVAIVGTDSLVAGLYRYWWGYYPRYGWLSIPYLTFFFGMMIASLRLYWIEYRRAPVGSMDQRRVRTLLVAFGIVYLASFDYLAKFGVPFYPCGYVPVLMFLLLSAWGIWRYRLVDITPAFAATKILETMQGAVIVIDVEGKISLVNRAASQMLGYARDELLGKPFEMILESDDLRAVDRLTCEDVLHGLSMAWRTKDARRIDVSVSSATLPDGDGAPAAIVCVAMDVTERNRTEEALRAANRQLEELATLVESSEVSIIGKTLDGMITSWNKGAERLYGYTASEALGRPISLIVPYAQADELPRIFERLRRGESVEDYETVRVRKDGMIVYVSVTISPVRDHAGQVVGASVIARDITERKRAEEAMNLLNAALAERAQELVRSQETLRHQTQILRSMLDSLADGVIVTNELGEFLLFNPAAERILGIGMEAVSREQWTEHYGCFLPDQVTPYPPDQLPLARAMRGECLDDVEIFIRNAKKPGGLWVSVNARPLKDDAGALRGGVIVFRDITERKRAEEELQEMNAKLASNQQALLEAWTRLKDSHEQLKDTQLQLIQAEKMESIGRLAAGVAHEVKNPLAITLMGVEYLNHHVPSDNPRVSLVLRDMEDAVHRADRVIKGLLDFSTPRTLDTASGSLNDVIEQSLLLVKQLLVSGHITLVKKLDSGLSSIPLDRTKIEQVFVNLFMNAIHAMPQGGTLTVRTSMRRAAVASANGKNGKPTNGRQARCHDDELVVAEVEDTGTGIPEEYLGRVFDPFFTTKPTGKGTGLGLTVARTIIELHRGSIEVVNQAEGGVRVTIAFKTAAAGSAERR